MAIIDSRVQVLRLDPRCPLASYLALPNRICVRTGRVLTLSCLAFGSPQTNFAVRSMTNVCSGAPFSPWLTPDRASLSPRRFAGQFFENTTPKKILCERANSQKIGPASRHEKGPARSDGVRVGSECVSRPRPQIAQQNCTAREAVRPAASVFYTRRL
jgi:hypothetical protein